VRGRARGLNGLVLTLRAHLGRRNWCLGSAFFSAVAASPWPRRVVGPEKADRGELEMSQSPAAGVAVGPDGAHAVANPAFCAKAALANLGLPSRCGGLDPCWVKEGLQLNVRHRRRLGVRLGIGFNRLDLTLRAQHALPSRASRRRPPRRPRPIWRRRSPSMWASRLSCPDCLDLVDASGGARSMASGAQRDRPQLRLKF
jgi:hypothetical protein